MKYIHIILAFVVFLMFGCDESSSSRSFKNGEHTIQESRGCTTHTFTKKEIGEKAAFHCPGSRTFQIRYIQIKKDAWGFGCSSSYDIVFKCSPDRKLEVSPIGSKALKY